MSKSNFPVDIVYTWCDDSDPVWNKKRLDALSKVDKKKVTQNGIVEGRFQNHDELKYSLRSVEHYIPWVRRIYIVTDNQVPEWLNVSHPKIKIIDHSVIFPKWVKRPVFNSLLIEWFIHRIPGLAEHFIYFNDDMLILKSLNKKEFFQDNKTICHVLINNQNQKKSFAQKFDFNNDFDFFNSLNNQFQLQTDKLPFFKNSVILANTYYPDIDFSLMIKHCPYAQLKSESLKIYNKNKIFLKKFMYKNQFRARNDIFHFYLYAIDNYKNNKIVFSESDDLFEYALGATNYSQEKLDIFKIFSNYYKFLSLSQGDDYDQEYIKIAFSCLSLKFNHNSEFELTTTNNFDSTNEIIEIFKSISDLKSAVIIENEKLLKSLNKIKFELSNQLLLTSQLQRHLDKIYNGRIWRVAEIYFKIRDLLLTRSRSDTLKVRTTTQSKNLKIDNGNYEQIELVRNFLKINNIQIDNHVNIYTHLYYDFDGIHYYNGGAERYLVDLINLIKSCGYNTNIFQDSNKLWHIKHGNIAVIGLGANSQNIITGNYSHHLFQTITADKSVLNIYSPFFINLKRDITPAIGISHGVAWDSETNCKENFLNTVDYHKKVLNSAGLFDSIISVDTNTCKWFQTFDYNLSLRFKYIPNYVDLNIFKPKHVEKNNTIILYPRRFYKPRGLYLAIEASKNILPYRPDVEFHFAGRGENEDMKSLIKLQRQFSKQIKIHSYDFDEMHLAYQNADISIIPTLYSEGTSLSLLEAMASGNAVVATRIGGLTDVVIDSHNGLLIEPNQQALINAIILLLDNLSLRRKLQKNALKTAEAFSKDRWDSKWKSILNTYLLR